MCLIVLAYRVHPRYPLIVLANRDEFLDRPTTAAHFWSDRPGVLAGRDQRAGGTWMGVSTYGRFAALTNHRDLRKAPIDGPSRGELVVRALEGELPAMDEQPMEGYNLIHGPIDSLNYRSNVLSMEVPLSNGIHGLSNAHLDTPWPKVERLKRSFAELLELPDPHPDAMFDLLLDRTIAADEDLPDTGLDNLRERALSAAFIATPGYGTRCSTLLLVDVQGGAHYEERTHQPPGRVLELFNITQ